ncbi:MIP/aquaporin family protein [Lysobacter enzymogenes]|uniref:Aquaporin family protein n=1 Tax=Lysobacter enzymogenes TaxID=69 RepID=A0A3N2RAV5_LYSEN|nr:MIP/aquaporin family protein [Lysobacter enzymogenes]ROU04547.1 aquaporin family protein [Lysobacter enzymogenes]
MASPVSQYLSEFIATAMLILLGNGVVAGALLNQSKAQGAGWGVITAAWGLAVLIGIYIAGPTSGAIMNPALTIGLASIGKLAWALVPGFVLAQVAGAFLGATLVWLTYLAHWRISDDPELKRAIFCTSPAIRDTKANLLTEAIGTFALTFGALAIGANSFAPGMGPLGVSLLVVVIGMSLGGPTGYAINPARDLGPRIAHALLPIAGKGGSDWGYAWVPVVAPIVGAVLGAFAFQGVYG